MKFGDSAFIIRCAVVVGTLVLSAGCQLNGSNSSSKAGELGNGSFTFACDDSVACNRWSGDATRFPRAVALGSTFRVSFTPRASDGLNIHINEAAADRGITVGSVGDYVTRGPSGLAATKPGWATIAARDASGNLADYVVLRIAKPTKLAVFDGEAFGSTSPEIGSLQMKPDEQRSLRALPRTSGEDLAGEVKFDWTSIDEKVLQIVSTTTGKVNVVAKGAGTTKLVVEGASFRQELSVEVKP